MTVQCARAAWRWRRRTRASATGKGLIEPAGGPFTYSFALKTRDGTYIYHQATGLTHVIETPFRVEAAARTPFATPPWAAGAVMYQIFPERFANGRPEINPANSEPWGSPPQSWSFQGGDLYGIAERMAYIADLGIEVIYLNPINSAPSNHKYDAQDFYSVDPALGGAEGLHALVKAAHDRDVRVILDASFNHCNPRFFAFRDLIENGADSPYRDWFTIHEFPIRVVYRPHLVPDAQRARLQRYIDYAAIQAGLPIELREDDGPALAPTYHAWYGVLTMPQLNQSNPDTRAYFLDVARHWLRTFDVDGWRMDVVQFVVNDFWPDFRRAVRAERPDAYLLAEVWGDTSAWLQGDQFDGTMNYLFRELALDFFIHGSLDGSGLGQGVTRMIYRYAPEALHASQNLLSSHDVERFLSLAGEDTTTLLLATVFQFTLPGMPSIYYGDEIGMRGGHDPDNRRAFPWQAPESWERELQEAFRALAQLRRASPALRRGSWRLLWSGPDAIAYARTHEAETVVTIINRAAAPLEVVIPAGSAPGAVLWGDATVSVTDGGWAVSLPPRAAVIIREG